MVSPAPSSQSKRPLIPRPRLVARIAQRFERRLTIVVGGGGAGKTTILQQAVEAETDHIDVVHSCTAVDRDPGRLLVGCHRAALDALGGDVDGTAPLDAIEELVLAHSPRQVCVVIDDTHRLDRFDDIEELLTRLPANGHVLLAGRRRPALDTARLDAAGQLLEVTQDDLLMTPAEQIEFANLRGIDVAILEGAEGWPAFVELASTGSEARSRRYLEEEALAEIAPEMRHSLAAFAFVGGGDDELAVSVTGRTLEDLVTDLPLVRWDGEEARLHDLWGELLVDELDDDEQVKVALAGTGVLRAAGRFDRAIDLARSVKEWDDLTLSIGAAVRDGVDGGLRADQLRSWRRMIPREIEDDGVVVLIDGLIARERDPTSDEAWERLDRAHRLFEATGRPELELVALMQLGYVSRIRGELERLEPVLTAARELSERYPPARPFLAFGEAWTALAYARPDLVLESMESVRDAELPPVWRVTRDHLIALALFSLGRPSEALERVPREIETLPVPVPGALVTESQCLWYAGQPQEARRRRPAEMSDRYGARDRFIAGGWNALMAAFAGDLETARVALDFASASLGDNPSVLVSAQTAGVGMLIKLVDGDERGAANDIRAILELAPLGQGVSEQMLRNVFAVPYVLDPSSRPFWDEYDFGPSLRIVRESTVAFVGAREEDRPGALARLDWPEPGLIAAYLPCPWAIEFALRGLGAGRSEGRRLAAWLCEHWGEPARAALRSWLDDDDLGDVAREMLAQTPSPPRQRIGVEVLGQTNVNVDGYPTDDPNLRRERVRALLVSLILRPSTTRDQLAGVLWPDQPTEKAAKNLRTTLGYVHGLLEPRRAAGDATWFVRVDGHQVRLHHDLDVDLWRFTDILDEADRAERAGKPNTALPLLLEATALWKGDLATDLDLEWLDLERIHLRSRFVRASCRAAELLVATREPERAIEVVRPALDVDQWNEPSYLALAAAYDALGDHTSARAVIERGEAAIGTSIGARS